MRASTIASPATLASTATALGPVWCFSSEAASSTTWARPTGASAAPFTRENPVSVRVMARTRPMFDAMLARPFSSISGEPPRRDCRICTIEWIAASGLLTSWHTPATMKPSDARRVVCASAPAGASSTVMVAPAAHGLTTSRSWTAMPSTSRVTRHFAAQCQVAGERGMVLGESRCEAGARARGAGLHRSIRGQDLATRSHDDDRHRQLVEQRKAARRTVAGRWRERVRWTTLTLRVRGFALGAARRAHWATSRADTGTRSGRSSIGKHMIAAITLAAIAITHTPR